MSNYSAPDLQATDQLISVEPGEAVESSSRQSAPIEDRIAVVDDKVPHFGAKLEERRVQMTATIVARWQREGVACR